MAFVKRTTAPSKDDPNYYSNKNIFVKYNYPMPNCPTYCEGRCWESWGEPSKCRHSAGLWIEDAKKAGRKIGTKPVLGAIAVWRIPGTEKDGHVAFVEEVYSNNDFNSSNSAYKGTLFYMQRHYASKNYEWTSSKTGKKYVFEGFILPPKSFDHNGGALTVTGSLHLRERPDKNSKSIAIMHKGDLFSGDGKTEEVNGTKWIHGTHALSGKIGWASSKYMA